MGTLELIAKAIGRALRRGTLHLREAQSKPARFLLTLSRIGALCLTRGLERLREPLVLFLVAGDQSLLLRNVRLDARELGGGHGTLGERTALGEVLPVP